jgi:hypothetical protein
VLRVSFKAVQYSTGVSDGEEVAQEGDPYKWNDEFPEITSRIVQVDASSIL